MNDTDLNWEMFLTGTELQFQLPLNKWYNELLFGEKARLPSFPNVDIQKLHYGETSAAKVFNLLQKLQKNSASICNGKW
jgi:hypothetical protein